LCRSRCQRKPENKKQRYFFFLPVSLIERMKNIVYAERMTVTGLVLDAITRTVEKHEKKPRWAISAAGRSHPARPPDGVLKQAHVRATLAHVAS
jgi:hypothetical protein